MSNHAPRLHALPAVIGLVAVTLLAGMSTLDAGQPRGASYCTATDRIFWFVHTSDVHIGARGSTDADRLRWIVGTGRSVIQPAFIVVTGDLTDSTDGNIFGYPNGPHQAEWNEYKNILSAAGVAADFYYDLPGNHDAYNDATFAYYRANSVQGRATGQTQLSWTKTYPFGTYHFLGINSSDNTGDPFSLTWPWGDYAGLDAGELAFIRARLIDNLGANLTFVFGHHPVTDTGSSDDTWLYYGHQQFIADLDYYGASSYGYGHTHDASTTHFAGNPYTGSMINGGMRYVNVASLGKSSASQYSIVAVDCDGVSSVTQSVSTWPVVLITAPVSKRVGGVVNPYGYVVPNAADNSIRALVFDAGTVTAVSFRVDAGSVWQPMAPVPGSQFLWNGAWNASGLAAGEHTIEVRAVGTTTQSQVLAVEVAGAPPANQPPVAANDGYTTTRDVPLTVGAPGVLGNDSDPEGGPITAVLAAGPAHGSLTLNANGSFTYVPAAGFTGVDSFTYSASDGSLTSGTATVALTVNAPVTDSVTITSATYTRKSKRLSVTATSTAQPNATLTLVGYGVMTWKAKSRCYTITVNLPAPPTEVKVSSSLGGTATSTVAIK